MNQLFYGSICLTDLINHAKKQHSAFTKAENGKIYANVNVWLNEEEDKFGNNMAIQLNPKKENIDSDGRPYFGNMKKSEPKPITSNDLESMQDDIDGLPF